MTTVPNFLDFTINAVFRPTFIRKLYHKLSSILTFTFIQIFGQNFVSLLNGVKVAAFAWYSVKIRVMSGFKDEKFIKKQAYVKKN